MAATTTFQLTFPEVCWSDIIITTRASQALCREKSFACCSAIYQTECDSLYVLCCVKRNILGGYCLGSTGCGAKKRSVQMHVKN